MKLWLGSCSTSVTDGLQIFESHGITLSYQADDLSINASQAEHSISGTHMRPLFFNLCLTFTFTIGCISEQEQAEISLSADTHRYNSVKMQTDQAGETREFVDHGDTEAISDVGVTGDTRDADDLSDFDDFGDGSFTGPSS